MVEPTDGGVFPFGLPVSRRRPTAKSRRRVYVLGALPSALHIAWWSPARKLVKALAVNNEPTPFWNGAGEEEHIAAWRRAVGFRVGEWGEVAASEAANGAAGRWVDHHVLSILGFTREETCFSTCVDTYFTDAAGAFAVIDRYEPVARDAGLPPAHLPLRPRDGGVVELAVASHGERLSKELSVVVPEMVITLGNAALRVLRVVTQTKDGPAKLHPDARYGVEQPLLIGKRRTIRLPLTHPNSPGVFEKAHMRWVRSRTGGS